MTGLITPLENDDFIRRAALRVPARKAIFQHVHQLRPGRKKPGDSNRTIPDADTNSRVSANAMPATQARRCEDNEKIGRKEEKAGGLR